MRQLSFLIVCALFAGMGAAQTTTLAGAQVRAQPGAVPPGGQAGNPNDGQVGQAATMSGSLGELFGEIATREPIRRAGMRAAVLRQVQLTVPIVVVVDDAASYLFALSNWEGAARFPVLWDDGTVETREHIARFVRAFDPEKVLRIEHDGDYTWSGDGENKQEIFERALGRALSETTPDWRDTLKQLAGEGVVSPGIVITDATDTAWPAALALAAGRMQPVGFVSKSTGVWKELSVEDSDALARSVEHAARDTGRSWEGIGDDIDAITLALNTGTKIKTGAGPRDRLATTDRIGRRDSMGGGERWAWCGQIIGKESAAVYQAMCALFLSMDQGFVWDGYGSNPPWDAFDGTQAADALEQAGMEVELHDQPRYRLADWKQRMVRPVGNAEGDAGSSLLMLMNSKGGSRQFYLPDGNGDGWGKPGDMPVFDVPVAVHIVHSFSLEHPMSRATVGGRLIERGAYLYAGSVDEPYLQAFVPTPAVARRLAASLHFAAAVRFDEGDAWKVTVLGDPLMTVGPAGRRVNGDIEVEGALDLSERAKELLKEEDFAGAIRDLVMLGRDGDVARLAIALMGDKPEAFTAEAAMMSAPSLYRAGEYTRMLDAFERLDADGRVDGLMQDLLWLSSPYLLARGGNDAQLLSRVEAVLRANLREDQKIQDAETLAMHLRARSPQAAVGVLEALRPTLNENQRTMLDRAISRVTQ